MTYTAADRERVMSRRYRKTRLLKQLRGEPTSLVPANNAAKHAARLVDLGWSCAAIHQLAGATVSDTTIVNLTRGRYATIERDTEAAVLNVPLSYAVPAQVDDTAKVPLGGAQRRIHALMRLGWSHPVMREKSGVDTSHISRGTYPQITARKWRAVDAMYRELQMKPGPSTATAARALKAGHAPALAWENVDNPAEKPQGHNIHKHHKKARNSIDEALIHRVLAGEWGRAHNATVAERVEICRRWTSLGGSMKTLEQLTGWKSDRYWKTGEDAA